MNRKKKIIGKATEESMQTHGEGLGADVSGGEDYEGRKEQVLSQGQAPQAQQPAQQPAQQQSSAQRPQSSASFPFAQLGGAAQKPQSTQQQSSTQQAQSKPQQSASMFSGSERPVSSQQSGSGMGGLLGGLLGGGGSSSGGSGKKGMSPILLIVLALVVFFLLRGGLFGGDQQSTDGAGTVQLPTATSAPAGNNGGNTATKPTAAPQTASNSDALLQQMLGNNSWYGQQTGYSAPASINSVGAVDLDTGVRNGVLDTTVASGSRAKYTRPLGQGQDTVTVMIYMCGADLESRSAMGTKDLQEMLSAKYGDNVRVIIFTGGSKQWRNNLVQSNRNQVWQVAGGRMDCLVDNAGTSAMTDPKTLTAFIQYCAQNFPASRYGLILWDHGCGSVSGYGYDENNTRSGSMSLAGLKTAFDQGGVKFDFIGFDACLMATVETALMASDYADYLIASEETEPGIGWYYTDWLTMLGRNSSVSTLELGQRIADDFVKHCGSECRGQKTTLSVIDLAELSHTVPSRLKAFSQSISSLISNQEYRAVSNARNGSREFASSNRIDQVDLTDLCFNLNTQESRALASALRGAVKYNRINNISNAHGLSVYFPYQQVRNVDKAVSTYAAIGMDSSYSQAIRDFASVEASGQAVSSYGGSAMPSLFGGYDTSSGSGDDLVGELLSAFLGGGYGRVGGLDGSNTAFLADQPMDKAELEKYLKKNRLDATKLVFHQAGNDWVLELPVEQWAMVSKAEQNVFYDNGKGYVDLGLDTLFHFDDQGRMVADMDGTWMSVNGQVVAYYSEGFAQDESGAWYAVGRVPALVDGDRVNLLLATSNDTGDSQIIGIRYEYVKGETETVAKAVTLDELFDFESEHGQGRKELPMQFIANLYDYGQNLENGYEFGNETTLKRTGNVIGNMELPDASKMLVTYRFTDIYNQTYWTPVVGR